MGTLYVVATPIGNLEDLTRRAERVLGEVDHVFAENTRRTAKLLGHLGIDVATTSLHRHNEAARTELVLERLAEGAEAVALVSDAGTPLVSDPGARLVEKVLEAGHDVVPVPGPSAVTAALVGSGMAADRFLFLGFPPRKGAERSAVLERVAASPDTVVLFESPGRLSALLDALAEACGAERRAAVARELTKLHETFARGTLAELRARYAGEGSPRGEVTVVVEGAPEDGEPDEVDEAAAAALARALVADGSSPSRAAREVARRLDIPRNLAYRIVHEAGEG